MSTYAPVERFSLAPLAVALGTPCIDILPVTDVVAFAKLPRVLRGQPNELAHTTKTQQRLNRSYGDTRFGNTSYAREEIVAELASCFLGQELGFSAHTLEMSAAYLDNWLRVLRSDKTAIFKHAADAQHACDWLIAASTAGHNAATDEAA